MRSMRSFARAISARISFARFISACQSHKKNDNENTILFLLGPTSPLLDHLVHIPPCQSQVHVYVSVCVYGISDMDICTCLCVWHIRYIYVYLYRYIYICVNVYACMVYQIHIYARYMRFTSPWCGYTCSWSTWPIGYTYTGFRVQGLGYMTQRYTYTWRMKYTYLSYTRTNTKLTSQ